jgi:ribose transport system permease protein
MKLQSISSTKEIFNNYGATFGFFVAIVFFSIVGKGFWSQQNLENIIIQSTSLGICAFGLTLVLLMGDIDLSYAGVVGLVGALLAGLLKEGHSLVQATLLCMSVGLVTGLINAALIVFLRLPSFLVTVAVMFLCMGAERVYNQGITTWITNNSALTLIRGHIGPVPAPIVYMFAVFLICWFLQTQTRWGHYIRGLGENINAITEVGIRARMLKTLVYVIAGILFAFGGYLETLRNSGAVMYAGKQLMLSVLTACFLSTASFKAGKYNFPGTLLGAFFLYTLMSGFTALGLKFYLIPVAQGLILIAAVAISSVRREKIEQVQF